MNINKIVIIMLLTSSFIANSSDAKPATTYPQETIIKTIAARQGYAITDDEIQAIKTAANGSVAISGVNLNILLQILTIDHINLMTRGTAGEPRK